MASHMPLSALVSMLILHWRQPRYSRDTRWFRNRILNSLDSCAQITANDEVGMFGELEGYQ
jgi:hypothetical protein